MRTVLTRAAAAAAVLLVAAPAVAGAAVDDYAAEASTSAVRLSVFESQVGSALLDLVGTDAFGSSDPVSSASIDPVEVLGTVVGETRSVTSERERQRDPESGDGCMTPAAVTGLTLDAVCTLVSARAGNPGDTGNQDATAVTDLLDVQVDGSLVAGVLTTPLGDVLAAAGDLAIQGAIDEFLVQCNTVLEGVDASPVTSTATELLGMAPEELEPIEQGVSDAVGEADSEGYCAAVFNLSTGELSETVLDVSPVTDALAGRDLITLTVDGAQSAIAGTDTSMGATADQVFVTIGGPSLDFLDDVVTAVVDSIVAEVEAIAGGDEPLPLPEDFDLQPVFDAIPLFGITDPLLTATVSGGSATADLDLEAGTTSASGEEPFVTVAIAPGIVELLGGDPGQASMTLSAGESMTFAEGTPLESSISVGDVSVDDAATFEDTGLVGSSVTASATEVALLTGVEDGIELTLAQSNAGVYGASVTSEAPNPAPEDPLPNTGGGAAVAAVAALGIAVALRRRRD